MTTKNPDIYDPGFMQFRAYATMRDGSRRVATVCGLTANREPAETMYHAALVDATRQARELFKGATQIEIL